MPDLEAPLTSSHSLELWAGPECTCNRVGDRFSDQLERIGHGGRIEDLALIAGLGAKAIRYPVLWEKAMPLPDAEPAWAWSDERLATIRELGMRAIVGLLHHGSGPIYTSLIDPEFPQRLGEYAGRVAERYPWVKAYTPVNEPLTTARFSGLYGHWYPHLRHDRAFVRALLNQVHGTVLAMREIRKVNPEAQLVQTEDLGFTASSPLLQYQADFENERRWLSLDLLCGNVTPSHRLWNYLLASGASERELRWLHENSCRPDILGFNFYLTSQRFLHENVSLYPAHVHGGNHRHRYADVELVRVRDDGMIPLDDLLLDAWERFAIPQAITECHNGCSREEQLRWLRDVWQSVRQTRAAGVDVRAVTAWSVFGAVDWNTLLTEERGHYEPGVYDVRSPHPRPTALVQAWQRLGEGGELSHPILQVPGWWARPDRFAFGFSVQPFGAISKLKRASRVNDDHPEVSPILITGARGTLARQLAAHCEIRAIPHRLLTRAEMDISDPDAVDAAFAKYRPWAVLNAAGYVRVDEAEGDPRCWRENAAGPENLARACAAAGARLVTFSSDLVFDGRQSTPYVESDAVAPLNEYGRSKAAAERAVLAIMPQALVIRTSAFFSAVDDYNFVTIALRALAQGDPFPALTDCTVSPTFVPDLVRETLDLLVDGECGIWHLANRGEITWYELAKRAAGSAGISTASLYGITLAEANWPASRPAYSVLASERGWIMPSLEAALARYLEQCDWLADRIAA